MNNHSCLSCIYHTKNQYDINICTAPNQAHHEGCGACVEYVSKTQILKIKNEDAK